MDDHRRAMNEVSPSMTNVMGILPVLVGIVFAIAAFDNTAFAKTLQIHGVEYPHSCGKVETAELKKTIYNIAGAKRAPDRAWQILNTLLCRKANSNNVNFLLKNMAPRITTSSYGTGDREAIESEQPASREIALSAMNQGVAWGAYVSKSGDEIEINNRPNEACVNGGTLSFMGKSWLLVKVGSACD